VISRTALIALIVLAPGLSGCTTLSNAWARLTSKSALAQIRPAQNKVAEVGQVTPVDRLYKSASAAINRRDYGSALDLLQMAKERSPNDPRVLNALGVVYDKLGRFDLSQRYYAQALVSEPGSPIVLGNLAYSDILSNRVNARVPEAPAPALAASPAPAPAVVAEASTPTLTRAQPSPDTRLALALAEPVAEVKRAEPLLLGRPLMIVNATGRLQGQEPVTRYLASAGWSISDDTSARASQAESEIRYEAQHQALAASLAKSLPFPVRMKSCDDGCSGVVLVVGSYARATTPRAKG
jgi:tetratricopeptide (TPR) repeat protein